MATAVTNAARYTVRPIRPIRPIGPFVAGAVQQIALCAPLLVAGTVKAGYDLALWRWARRQGIGARPAAAPRTAIADTAGPGTP